MSKEPRIRDVYRQYHEGKASFDEVVRAADKILDNRAASTSDNQDARPGSASFEANQSRSQ